MNRHRTHLGHSSSPRSIASNHRHFSSVAGCAALAHVALAKVTCLARQPLRQVIDLGADAAHSCAPVELESFA